MVGIGYDIHRLVDKRDLYLGGVKIDFPKGLLGHSDGDVLLHAVCDALLGAANLGDIGSHFPPDDDRFNGIASIEILRTVSKFLRNSGFLVKNIDAVVITESPKILPYASKIKKNIASALGISEQVVSVKGKTNEGLGPVGEGRAIASFAICEIGRIYDTPEG